VLIAGDPPLITTYAPLPAAPRRLPRAHQRKGFSSHHASFAPTVALASVKTRASPADETHARHHGYHTVGPNATEMIAEPAWAVLRQPPNWAMRSTPTDASEAVHEAALAVSGESIHFYAPLRQAR
jgi:hypothetical protein